MIKRFHKHSLIKSSGVPSSIIFNNKLITKLNTTNKLDFDVVYLYTVSQALMKILLILPSYNRLIYWSTEVQHIRMIEITVNIQLLLSINQFVLSKIAILSNAKKFLIYRPKWLIEALPWKLQKKIIQTFQKWFFAKSWLIWIFIKVCLVMDDQSINRIYKFTTKYFKLIN